MIAKATKLRGVFIIEPQFEDERGFFARAWSESELAAPAHCAVCTTRLIRCTRGSIYDVGVDIRKDSATFGQWVGIELSAENRLMLYLPGDVAHGYLSLEDNIEVYYQVTQAYSSESGRGFRWNDPTFGIEWPQLKSVKINKRDREYPDFKL